MNHSVVTASVMLQSLHIHNVQCDSEQTSELAGLSLWSFQCNDVALHNNVYCTKKVVPIH